MDFTLILLILGFALLVFLIFKFIKKIIFAVLTLVLLVVLIIGTVFGLVYLDYNYLKNQKDFDVNIVYKDGEDYVLGAVIPVKNKSMDFEAVSGLDGESLSSIDVDSINSDDDLFVITVDKALYYSLLNEESYEIPGMDSSEFADYDTTLNPDEVKRVMEATDAIGEYLEIVFVKNDIDDMVKSVTEPMIRMKIESELDSRNMDFKQMIFLVTMSSVIGGERNVLTLIEGYKDEEIMIYPERFTFKLLKYLPAGTIKSFIPEVDVDNV